MQFSPRDAATLENRNAKNKVRECKDPSRLSVIETPVSGKILFLLL